MAFNLTFDVIELAKLQSAITGVLAGFALTVAILLMGQKPEGASVDKYDVGVGQAAVMVFVTAAFSGVLASFLFALMGSEVINSGRAFMMLISAGFVFTLSAVLVIYGLFLSLGAFRLTHALGTGKAALYATIALTLGHYALGVAWARGVMDQVSTGEVLGEARTCVVLFAAPSLLPLCAIGRRRLDRSYDARIPSRSFNGFTIACVVLCAIAGMLTAFIQSLTPPDVIVPLPLMLLFVIAYSFLIAWLILLIPTSESEATDAVEDGPVRKANA